MKVICLRILVLIMLFAPFQAIAQEAYIRGVVSDNSGPLPGATVALYNKDNRAVFGKITDMNGEYNIRIPADQDVVMIVFSFIGFKTNSIKYTKQAIQNVKLIEDNLILETVDVVARAIDRDAMGIDTKALGGARQKIDLDDLQDMAVTSVGDMLQGKIANMDLVASSGAPGAKMSIRIRGTASLNSTNEPLIVINDIPQSDINISSDFDFGTATEEDFGSLVNISPSDIQSIEVLKDASATAIWGAQAANGVLLITTKVGRKSAPRFQITQKISTSIEPKKMPLLNAKEYVTLMQDALWNKVRDDEYTNLHMLQQFQDIRYNPNYKYFNEFNQDVDWLDYLITVPINSETNFSMEGGGDKATYRFSASYLTDKGTTIGENFKRINTRLNLNYQFSNKFRVASEFSYSEGNRNSAYIYENQHPRDVARRKMPNLTPFILDDAHNFTDEYFNQPKESIQGYLVNPIALANDAKSNRTNRDANIQFNLNYKILSNLQFNTQVSFSLNTSASKSFLPVSATGVAMNDENYNKASESSDQSNNLYISTLLNYNKRFAEKHSITVAVRFNATDNASTHFSLSSYGNPTPSLGDPSNNGNLLHVAASKGQGRNVAFIGSVSYSYKDRVNLNAAFRQDGNSGAGRNSRWVTFPSLSASWYLNEEPFLKDVEWLSDLRPRIGWGRSGTSPYGSSTYAGTYEALSMGYVDMTAIKPNSMQMNNLSIETVQSYNYGLSVGLLSEKITFSFDYYTKKSYDLLQKDMRIQSTTGYSSIPWFNDGSILNQGWEFNINGNNFIRYGDFRVSANFNISRNENEVVDLPMNLEYQSPSVSNGSYSNKIMEGRPLGSFFGFRYMGVYQNIEETYARDRSGNIIKDVDGENIITRVNGTHRQRPGDAKYYDVNFDGIIDKYDVVYLGNSQPLFLGGASITFMYRGISLRTSAAYRIGQSVINRALLNAESMEGGNNQATSVLRRWRYEGDDTDIPRALWGTNYNSLGSDRYVNESSFMKIKDITLSYRLQDPACKRLRLKGVYLYLTAYDPFTITKYKGQDPEVGIPGGFHQLAEDNSLSPRSRRFAFGITVDF